MSSQHFSRTGIGKILVYLKINEKLIKELIDRIQKEKKNLFKTLKNEMNLYYTKEIQKYKQRYYNVHRKKNISKNTDTNT